MVRREIDTVSEMEMSLIWVLGREMSTYLYNSLSWMVMRSSHFRYEVLSQPSHSVDLEKRECSCYEWQTEGFACSHAVIVIATFKFRVEDYVEEFFCGDLSQIICCADKYSSNCYMA